MIKIEANEPEIKISLRGESSELIGDLAVIVDRCCRVIAEQNDIEKETILADIVGAILFS